jgi:hypothetical protein
MQERYASDEGIEWKHADVRELPKETGGVDVAFDKGTLDAMIFGSPWSPPDVVKENTKKYMDEVRYVFERVTFSSKMKMLSVLGKCTVLIHEGYRSLGS